MLVLPSHHRLAKMKRLSISMLDDLPFIRMSRKAPSPLLELIASIYNQSNIPVRRAHEADSVLGHLNLVAAGLGFGLMPEYARAILPRGTTARPLDWNPPPCISVVAACRKGDELPALRTFMNVVRDCCK